MAHAPPQVELAGAWGARSFASALHAQPRPQTSAASTRQIDEDGWDVEAAWHELESRPGRKKRGNRLIVLGGVGGRKR
jgi:hypothetical protein